MLQLLVLYGFGCSSCRDHGRRPPIPPPLVFRFFLQWDYDDGFGSAEGRFNIDLFEADGLEDCGTFYTALCDQESIGCKDSPREFAINQNNKYFEHNMIR